MKEVLNKINVIVESSDENYMTIVKEAKPSHNSSRVIRNPEIVVRYFSDEDMDRLREIQLSSRPSGQSSRWSELVEKYTSFMRDKEKK